MMDLKLLMHEDDLVRIESQGIAARDPGSLPENGFEQLGGEAIYSRKVLLGLAKCHYVDSMGVGWLLEIHRKFCDHGGMLVIHSASATVMQILKLMRMDLVLRLAADEVQARRLAKGADA